MTKNKSTYETGATSHAVNDLILFTDQTRELAELRDKIYTQFANDSRPFIKDESLYLDIAFHFLVDLCPAARIRYSREFPNDSNHIAKMSDAQRSEFADLYAQGFETWKSEKRYK